MIEAEIPFQNAKAWGLVCPAYSLDQFFSTEFGAGISS